MSRASGWLNRCTCRDMYIYIYSYRGICKDIGTHIIGMLQDVKESGFRVEVFFWCLNSDDFLSPIPCPNEDIILLLGTCVRSPFESLPR